MALLVRCPHCQKRLSVPGRLAGTVTVCPQCQGQFQVPAADGSAHLSGEQGSPPAVPGGTLPAGSLPAGSLATGAAAVFRDAPPRTADGGLAPPAAIGRSARFKAVPGPASAADLVVDGRLPELSLKSPDEKKGQQQAGSGSNPLLVVVLLCISFGTSLLLLFTDFHPAASNAQRKADARRQLETYYGLDQQPLEPYQVLLREARQAASRGDREAERRCYHEVLLLLRAEGHSRFTGLTGTPKSDEELERLLAVLLAD